MTKPQDKPATAEAKSATAEAKPVQADTKPAAEGAKPQDGAQSEAVPDFEALSRNVTQFLEEAGKATVAMLTPNRDPATDAGKMETVGEMVRTLGRVAESWMTDPHKALEAQSAITRNFLTLWGETLRKMNGEPTQAVAQADPRDARFADKEWNENPVFDFLKQAYLITTNWANDLVERADGIDDHTRDKAKFYVKQLAGAMSPSNFVPTNPELLRATLKESGANLVRGMKMLAEDVEAGQGDVRIRQADGSRFEVGVNMATTPGAVVFRNDLIELIQYAPATETVLKRPLLIVPPWINKFYILDLNPDKSFIRWAVSQGLTVFCISWINPDERHRDMGFDAYMDQGILAALDAIKDATGETDVTTIGYCVGGTMLAVTLAYMAAMGDDRISSTTFFTTQVDFSSPGELGVFVDEAQIRSIETQMEAKGYLDGKKMASAFNMLRPNDLIWSYVVNNYMKGKEPMPFDMLFWNADSTRMSATNHSFYLRSCYLNNLLSRGEMVVKGIRLDLGKVEIPVFNLAAREDHIAPALSVFKGCKFFGGPVTYVLAGSGHIAGVINPPSKPKYQYWTGGKPKGKLPNWLEKAEEHPGSWWPYWLSWIEAQAPKRVKARQPGEGKLKPLCPAPGTYVKIKA